MIIEICAPDLASALAAERGGADRIELCSALAVGGLTPSVGLIESVLKQLKILVFPLIRCRDGDFCYSEGEIEVMCRDIDFAKKAGCAGAVVGCLLPNGSLDEPAMRRMAAFADADFDIVCHRAFDFVRDPFDVLERLIALGFRRILTSGGSGSALEGADRIRALIAQAAGRIEIMPGSGLSSKNIVEAAQKTHALSFHLSAKKPVKSPFLIKKNDPNGLGLDWQAADEAEVRTVRALLR